jgi:chemotaxis protein MotB
MNEQTGKTLLQPILQPTAEGIGLRRKRHEDLDSRNDSANGYNTTWMTTFADLCTLLLTFYVLVFSMSSLNERAFRYTFQMRKSLGTTYFDKEKVPDSRELIIQDLRKGLDTLHNIDIRDLEKVTKESRSGDAELGLLVSGRNVWIHRLGKDQDFSIIIGQQLLFESGEIKLNESAHQLLGILAGLITKGNYHCYIDGHTDEIPVHNERFESNEELSMARAAVVLDFLVGACDVDPAVLALGGYGDSHPLTDGKSPDERAANRRVEIIFRKAP